jgi:hypothetical protein
MEKTNCYIFAFATFGHPNDFRQTPYKFANSDIAKRIKVFDLSNAIKVFPNSKIYSIRKEIVGNSKLISYSVYTYAQEQGSKRDGTFIGSSIVLQNTLTEEKYVISCLNEFHQNLIEKNLDNGILKVNHSEDFLSVPSLKDFEMMNNFQNEIPELNFTSNKNNLVVYCDTSSKSLENLFRLSIVVLNNYDSIYFTSSDDVAKYVVQKGLFKLIQNVSQKLDFEEEANNILSEKQKKRERKVQDFEREIQIILETKNKALSELEYIHEENKRKHQENERILQKFKDENLKLSNYYDDFIKKSESLLKQLRDNKVKLEELLILHNSNKVLFNQGLVDLKRPNYNINSLSKSKLKIELPINEPVRNDLTNQESSRKENTEKNPKREKANTYKKVSLILVIILLISWIFMFKNWNRNSQEIDLLENKKDNSVFHGNQIDSSSSFVLVKLNPKPNSILNENDFRVVAKNISYSTNITDVVNKIFELNPTDIKSSFENQKTVYSEILFELNKTCFDKKNGSIIFVKDTIRKIPSFKRIL